MKRGGPITRRTPLRSAGRLGRGKGLRARKPRRLVQRELMRPYVRFVCTMQCINCGRQDMPSEPAHMTLGANEKGTSLKVPDQQVVPLCHFCHGYFDGRYDGPHNPFAGMSREDRWIQAGQWVKATQEAAIPSPDSMSDAFYLAELGVGRIVGHADGSWHWVPCWVDEQSDKEPT